MKNIKNIWFLNLITTAVRSIMSDGIKLDEPLGLPKGSIRALITIGLLGFWGITTSFLIREGLDVNANMPSTLNDLTIMAVSFYIGTRASARPEPSQVKSAVKKVDIGNSGFTK
jgi:hypothetical protein